MITPPGFSVLRANFPYKPHVSTSIPAGAVAKGNKELVEAIGGPLHKNLLAIYPEFLGLHMKKQLFTLAMFASAFAASAAGTETPAQVRRIVAQSVCLAIAYPDSAISRDNEAVYALYAPLLKVTEPLKSRQVVEKLALTAQPSSPSPVGGHNLALAKCTLFAERQDVLAMLGEGRRKR